LTAARLAALMLLLSTGCLTTSSTPDYCEASLNCSCPRGAECCVPVGEPCLTSLDCCEDASCEGGACVLAQPLNACMNLNGRCNWEIPCCAGVCSIQKCTCVDRGRCVGDADCCSGKCVSARCIN
jgi:hypothetical protein